MSGTIASKQSGQLSALKNTFAYNSVAPSTIDKPIVIWLILCLGMVLTAILVGGITRLTQSGLSMVEWQPIAGILPPLTHAQWQRVFELYQASPEFMAVNSWMGLEDFKSIFWWEYGHRVIGRLIGLAVFIPMVLFALTGRLRGKNLRMVMLAFVLGGCQGLLGWYMVKSGLVKDPHVSQYRLVAHLSLAILIYSVFLITLYRVVHENKPVLSWPKNFVRLGLCALILVAITLISGGFVAGTKAGFAFNTFPLMNGQWIPDGYGQLQPFAMNFFENTIAIQFNHRVLAIITFLLVVFYAHWGMRLTHHNGGSKKPFVALLVLVWLQVVLGITTLLMVVPVHLAATHQLVGVFVFTAALWSLMSVKRSDASS